MKLRLKYNAPVILTFALLCTAVLLVMELTHYQYMGWFITHRGSFASLQTWITMVSYVLGHASVEHFLGNMMLLLLVGPVVEEKYGSGNTLLIVLITAVVTAVINMLITPNGLIGCSGVVFALIILASMTSFKKGEIPLTLILVALLYLGQEVITGLSQADQVSQMAHLVGGVLGAGFGFVLNQDHSHSSPSYKIWKS